MDNKTICIVTVYNSINCGSYWQAFVLGEYLKSLGYNVCYLKRKGGFGSSNTFRAFLKRSLKVLLRKGIASAIRVYQQYISFLKCQGNLELRRDNESYKDVFCFILGSDTIWNLDSKYFAKNRKRYWGGDFLNKRVISYATSIANTSKEEIDKYPELKGYIDSLFAISVRDKHSYDVIRSISGKQVKIVCDPTILWNKDDYKLYLRERPDYNFIFLYLFKPLTDGQFNEVRQYAMEHNLKIIDGTNGDTRADMNVVCEPYNFLRYIYYADYIVTDTYHGTLFSTNFEKNFIILDRGKEKVNDFLQRVDLTSRIIGDSFSKLFDNDIDYKEIRDKLYELRKESADFINDSLMNADVKS